MRISYSGLVVAASLICTVFGADPARADIYKWVDDSGTVTFSNAPPKDLSRIIDVFKSSDWGQSSAPASPAEAAAQQIRELQALNERVEHLTRVLEGEGRGVNPVQSYAPPPPPQYAAGPAGWDGSNGGWDTPYFGSPYFGWPYISPPFISSAVVVGGAGFNKRFNHFNRVNHFNNGVVRPHPGFVPRTGGFTRSSTSRAGVRMR
jgi:uncharacterized protein DUF4124